MNPETCIFVIHDDESTAELIRRLAASMQLNCRVYRGEEDFLRRYDGQTPGCLVAEIRGYESDSGQFQQRLTDRRIRLPAIFITPDTDIRTAVRAMRHGAVTVLPHPPAIHELHAALHEALERDAETRRIDAAHASVRQRLGGLSPQDRSVLRLMVAGKSTSRIAAELDLDVPGVDACLASLLAKTQTATLVDLARLALAAELDADEHSA